MYRLNIIDEKTGDEVRYKKEYCINCGCIYEFETRYGERYAINPLENRFKN